MEADDGRQTAAGYRIKNKNPTQRCGEQKREKVTCNPSVPTRADRAGFGGKAATSETVAHVSQLFSATEPPFTRKNTMFRANPNTQIPSMM